MLSKSSNSRFFHCYNIVHVMLHRRQDTSCILLRNGLPLEPYTLLLLLLQLKSLFLFITWHCSQGGAGAQGAFAPTFFPESCNIYHFLPYKFQHQVVTVLFRVKNDHRKADYKAICKQTFELCLDRAVSCLESGAFDEFKGQKPERVI